VRFATFALDPQRHVLTNEGADVPLSPHLVDILHYLASRPGELVTKDALLDRFWTDVHVSDNTLTRAIADIRKVLGDDAAAPTFIQTVARRGYRFVAGTQETPHSAPGTELVAPDDPFREWVRGRFSLESLDAARLPAAVAAFEHAVTAAPAYAPAYAGLANACFLQYETTRAENQPNREPLMRALEQARRACELDPTLGEAWATLGFVLAAAGQFEEAGAAARRATALEPTSWRHHFRLAIASWGEARLRACDRTMALFPDFAPARFLSAMVFSARHAFAPALEAAAAGAATQERQLVHAGAPFPSVGLHWLHGLLLLREGRVGPAILAFAREIDESLEAPRIYAAEFRVNAQIGAGFAHLSADDAAGATDAFRSALETLPRNGRALLGLYQALSRTGLAPEAPQLLPQIDRAIAELAAGQRLGEAALITAALQGVSGDADAACDTLRRLLDEAPPGQVGWQIPIDPALAIVRGTPQYESVIAMLAARAS
jgi:DNA-binding winged helix-turn-helix (wHTH) protein